MFNLTGEDAYEYVVGAKNVRKRYDRFVVKLTLLTTRGYRVKDEIIADYVRKFYGGNVVKFLAMLLITLETIKIFLSVSIYYMYIFCLYVRILTSSFPELKTMFKISDDMMYMHVENNKSDIFYTQYNEYDDIFDKLPTYIYKVGDVTKAIDIQHNRVMENEYSDFKNFKSRNVCVYT
jgi:hypothetical protein